MPIFRENKAQIKDLRIENKLTAPDGTAITGSTFSYLAGITPGTATASKAVVLDASKDIATINILTAVSLVGALTGNVTGNLTGLIFGVCDAIDTDGAIALTSLYTDLDGSTETTSLAVTLADGTTGQIKILRASDVSVNAVVTPDNFADGTTITFDAVGEVAILLFDGTNWVEIYTDATVGA